MKFGSLEWVIKLLIHKVYLMQNQLLLQDNIWEEVYLNLKMEVYGLLVNMRILNFYYTKLDFHQHLYYRHLHLSRGLLAHPINSDPLGGQSIVAVTQDRFLKPI